MSDLPNRKGVRCLRCGDDAPGPFFCETCGGLCEPGERADYFTCLNLPRSLQIGLQDLERRFYALSARLHPDRFATGSSREKEASEIHTARLNRAYRCLKDPVRRANYVIEQEKITLCGHGQVPTDLAEEYFELQESAIGNPSGLEALLKRLHEKQEGLRSGFARLCALWGPGNNAVLQEIAENLNAQNYLRSMIRDIEMKNQGER